MRGRRERLPVTYSQRRPAEQFAGRKLTYVGGVITDSTRSPLQRLLGNTLVGPWEGDAKGADSGGLQFNTGTVGIWPACNFNYMEYGDGTFGIAAINTGDTNNATVTADNTVAYLFGSKSIVYQANAGGAVRAAQEATLSGSDAAGTKWSASVWVYVPSGSNLVGVSYTLHLMEIAGGSFNGNETTTTGTFASGWNRLRIENYSTVAANIGNLNLSLAFTAPDSSSVIYTSGWQLEKFPICTPYVHTHQNSRLSRNAGYILGPTTDPVTGGNVISAAQGWVALRFAPGWASTADLYSGGGINLFDWQASSTNRVQLIYNPATDKFTASIWPNGAQKSANSAAQTFSRGDHLTAIIKWDGSNISVSVNGGAFVNTAYTGTPTGMPSQWVLGARFDFLQQLAGDIYWTLAGSGTLTDADAATIHANGDTVPTSAPGTAKLLSEFSGGDWIVPAAAQTLTATLVLAGTQTRATSKALSGALAPAGSLSRFVAHVLAATLAMGGALNRAVFRAVAAALAVAGAVTKRTQRAVSGTVTSVGSFGPKNTVHVVAGFLTSAGSLNRSTLKGLAGTLTSVGALQRFTSRALAGTLTSAGALTKRTLRALTAAAVLVGNLATQLNHLGGNLYTQNLTATLSLAGSLSKLTSHKLIAVVAPAGSLAKQLNRNLAATLASAGALTRSVTRSMFLSATLQPAGALSRRTSRSLAAVVAPVGAVGKLVKHGLAAALAPLGGLVSQFFGANYGGPVDGPTTSLGGPGSTTTLTGEGTTDTSTLASQSETLTNDGVTKVG